VFGVRLTGLAPAAREAAIGAAHRAGLSVGADGEAVVLSGPSARFAAFREMDRAGAGLRTEDVITRFRTPPRVLQACGLTFDLSRPLIVGILNATPDSFYDHGRYFDRSAALARADEMVAEGADLIEIGGETARPGTPMLDAEEESGRVLPLIEALAGRLSIPIGVDTFKPEVARRAVEAGAVMINDISGLADLRMAEVAAASGAALVVMHIQGRPKVRQVNPQYRSVVDDVYAFLEDRTALAEAAGVPSSHVIVDPGLSFGKAVEHDLDILRRLGEFRSLGYPIYLATSRKNYIRDLLGLPPEDLLEGTAAAIAYGVAQGAHLVRTHDVHFMARVVTMVRAIMQSPAGRSNAARTAELRRR
jgi:dihydropteroate synthase